MHNKDLTRKIQRERDTDRVTFWCLMKCQTNQIFHSTIWILKHHHQISNISLLVPVAGWCGSWKEKIMWQTIHGSWLLLLQGDAEGSTGALASVLQKAAKGRQCVQFWRTISTGQHMPEPKQGASGRSVLPSPVEGQQTLAPVASTEDGGRWGSGWVDGTPFAASRASPIDGGANVPGVRRGWGIPPHQLQRDCHGAKITGWQRIWAANSADYFERSAQWQCSAVSWFLWAGITGITGWKCLPSRKSEFQFQLHNFRHKPQAYISLIIHLISHTCFCFCFFRNVVPSVHPRQCMPQWLDPFGVLLWAPCVWRDPQAPVQAEQKWQQLQLWLRKRWQQLLQLWQRQRLQLMVEDVATAATVTVEEVADWWRLGWPVNGSLAVTDDWWLMTDDSRPDGLQTPDSTSSSLLLIHCQCQCQTILIMWLMWQVTNGIQE